MVSDVSAHHDREGMAEKIISQHGNQEAENKEGTGNQL
jgi:hypothetical protein